MSVAALKGGIEMKHGKKDYSEPKIVEEVKQHVGVVCNCEKLNIRKYASKDSEVLTIVDAGTELLIDSSKSTANFYKVCTASGIEGYCMEEFVEVDK